MLHMDMLTCTCAVVGNCTHDQRPGRTKHGAMKLHEDDARAKATQVILTAAVYSSKCQQLRLRPPFLTGRGPPTVGAYPGKRQVGEVENIQKAPGVFVNVYLVVIQ